MRNYAVILAALVPFVLGAAQAPPPAVFPVEFSADMVSIDAKGGPVWSSRIYASQTKLRWDLAEGGVRTANIIDFAQDHMWMLSLDQKFYADLGEAGVSKQHESGSLLFTLLPLDIEHPCAEFLDTTCEKSGTDKVDGRSCEQWTATRTGKNGATKNGLCIDTKLHFLIRATNEKRDIMEIHNVHEAAQPASLFEIPADFRKLGI